MSTYNTRSLNKQLRETTGETTDSESPAKRQKLTRNLQLLYDEVKEKSQLLDAQLRGLLEILPTNESTAHERRRIGTIQQWLEKMMAAGEVKRGWAVALDEDFVLSQRNSLPNLTIVGEAHQLFYG